MRNHPDPKLKRCFTHDYHAPYIYMITVMVVDRIPILSKVSGSIEQPKLELTEVGKIVKQEIFAIEKCYPQVKVLFNIIMPDHVHLVLRVLERLPEKLPLGNIVAAWKQACGKAYSALLSAGENGDLKTMQEGSMEMQEMGDLKATKHDGQQRNVVDLLSSEANFSSPQNLQQEKQPYHPIFSKGFNDSILTGRHQLTHMMDYVKDNPRRLLIKRQHKELFAIHRGITVAGISFDAVGNIALLQLPKVTVHCRRRWSDEELEAYAMQCISAAENGAVLVGAFISKAEKAIEQTANEKHLPIIRIVENGFEELYKPVGQEFYLCAEGCLLLLAPWPYHSNKRAITREQCLQMNEMAENISKYNFEKSQCIH